MKFTRVFTEKLEFARAIFCSAKINLQQKAGAQIMGACNLKKRIYRSKGYSGDCHNIPDNLHCLREIMCRTVYYDALFNSIYNALLQWCFC